MEPVWTNFDLQLSTENFALLRKLALNLLNQEKSTKASNKMKRYRAAMDNEYLLKILNVPSYKSEESLK